MIRSTERVRIRYGETDQMGHAYYANYLFWFEQARGRWCRDHGFTYKELESRGIFLPAVEVHVQYRGEILYDDEIDVEVWVSEHRRASVRFDYEIRKPGQTKLFTEGYSWHVVMGDLRKAISIPDDLRAYFDRDIEELARIRDQK